MRRPTVFIVGLIAAAAIAPQTANAQFSPFGIIGAVTAPLRGMLDHRAHRSPRHRPAREAAVSTRQPSSAQQREQTRLGRSGPVAWPTAYEDVLGYTFWPADYGAQVRQHGFSDIVRTLIGPLDLAGPVMSQASNRPETTGTGNPSAAQGCAGDETARGNWPAIRIGQTMQLMPAQQTALDNLQTAIAGALKSIKAGCHDDTTLSPRERLSAMVDRLWAVQNAAVVIRAPLTAFMETLTDEQKAKFNPPAEDKTQADTKGGNGPMGRQYQACAAQAADADRFSRQIQKSGATTDAQRASLEALSRTSGDMAKLLMASCAQPVPDTPLARLDAANGLLTTMNFAATTMQVALNDLYAGLNDQQKARFDALGR
jgi:hypothetical protein